MYLDCFTKYKNNKVYDQRYTSFTSFSSSNIPFIISSSSWDIFKWLKKFSIGLYLEFKLI